MNINPERESDLVDLVDRLLNKGLILNADLIVSVAGIPLIGINLRAAIASIETMLDYGMMETWDKSIRNGSGVKIFRIQGEESENYVARKEEMGEKKVWQYG